jgi:hypothetical protein
MDALTVAAAAAKTVKILSDMVGPGWHSVAAASGMRCSYDLLYGVGGGVTYIRAWWSNKYGQVTRYARGREQSTSHR